MKLRLRFPTNEQLLRIACVLALVALPLMVWSLFDPTVWPVLIALSVGQAVGTLSFVIFLFAVARDLHLQRQLVKETAAAQAVREAAESAPDGEPAS
jgi:hypothetical protein